MREIKFRALSYCKGKYVYGFYAQIPSDGGLGSFIFDGKEWVEVRRETLGQFTGLLDKNGKEGYDEDIAKIKGSEDYYLISFWYGKWVLVHPPTCGSEITGECQTDDLFAFKPEEIEIVGNRLENPEILDKQLEKIYEDERFMEGE